MTGRALRDERSGSPVVRGAAPARRRVCSVAGSSGGAGPSRDRCLISLLANPLAWQVFPLAGTSTVNSTTLVVPPGFLGTAIYSQFFVLDGLVGAPYLVTASTNGLKQTIGLP